MAIQYKRILLKVSGEALSGPKGTGFDEETIASICAGIKAAHDLGAQIDLGARRAHLGDAAGRSLEAAAGGQHAVLSGGDRIHGEPLPPWILRLGRLSLRAAI